MLIHEVMHRSLNLLPSSERKLMFTLPEGMSGLEKIKQDFCARHDVPVSSFVAVGMHGDGVPTNKGKSADVYSWNFLADPALDRVLFTMVEKEYHCGCGCGGRHTQEAVLDVAKWCFEQLLAGEWPTARLSGAHRPLRGPRLSQLHPPKF